MSSSSRTDGDDHIYAATPAVSKNHVVLYDEDGDNLDMYPAIPPQRGAGVLVLRGDEQNLRLLLERLSLIRRGSFFCCSRVSRTFGTDHDERQHYWMVCRKQKLYQRTKWATSDVRRNDAATMGQSRAHDVP